MGEEEDRTFKSNFSEEGLGMLKERINEKLKEFMGDYTDDTLVEYVIVLLRNGRKKDDTAKELHVFLGDDNIPFISWLWDHLSSDLHLYLEPEQVPILQKDPQDEKDKEQIAKTGRKRQKIVWEEERERKKIVWDERGEERERGRERRKFPLRSVVSSVLSSVHERENNNNKNNNNRMVRERENSFNNNNRINNDNHNRLRNDRTRNNPEPLKRPFSQVVAPPRRLLQFAVRDAITPRSASRSEPIVNKPVLRSVLASDSFKEQEDQKEVQEYQENQEEEDQENQEEEQEYRNYQKRKEFDQENQEEEREDEVEEEEVEEEEEITYDKRGSRGGVVRASAGSGRLEGRLDGSGLRKREERSEKKKREGKSEGSSSGSVFDRLGRARDERGREDNVKQEEEEGYDDHVAEEEYSIVKQDNGAEKKSVQASQITNKPSKILNISVNVNTWKPAGTNVETHQFSLQNTNQTNKGLAAGNVHRETPKAVVTTPVLGGFKAAQSLEDPETRTLFVSNVHFGATKDALSRHFNKFGAVLKVIILLDTTTGQPTGTAFVEFLQKESAEAALSLNGTSFMSRILKVVRRNSSDSSQLPGYPIRRAGISGRARGMAPPPIRRMQWTRGTTTSTMSTMSTSTNQTVQQSPGVGQARSLVYTRVTQKTE